MIEAINWTAVSVLGGGLTTLGFILLKVMQAMIKAELTQQSSTDKQYTDLKFDELNQSINKTVTEFKNLEKEFLIFKAELPKEYVRREDWIRFIATIDAKLDTLNERQTNSNLQFTKLNESFESFIKRETGT